MKLFLYACMFLHFLRIIYQLSECYFQVAALFHIGNTKSHPPIPEHLSAEAKDFLLKCLQEYFRNSNFSCSLRPFFYLEEPNIASSSIRLIETTTLFSV